MVGELCGRGRVNQVNLTVCSFAYLVDLFEPLIQTPPPKVHEGLVSEWACVFPLILRLVGRAILQGL